ncbi:MAG: hypothetical protein AB4290_02545 [Spirulina sp.]
MFPRFAVILGVLGACLLAGYVWTFVGEARSPIAIARPTPMSIGQVFKDPVSLVRANYTPEEATEFAWRTFLALYAPDCSIAPVTHKQVPKGILYSVLLLLLYDILYDVGAKESDRGVAAQIKLNCEA